MTNHSTPAETNPFDAEGLVYIRHMDAKEVHDILPPNALDELSHPDDLFVVLTSDGERLAIVEGRDAAFAAAEAHSLTPLSVH